jgi:hypothetical protein
MNNLEILLEQNEKLIENHKKLAEVSEDSLYHQIYALALTETNGRILKMLLEEDINKKVSPCFILTTAPTTPPKEYLTVNDWSFLSKEDSVSFVDAILTVRDMCLKFGIITSDINFYKND